VVGGIVIATLVLPFLLGYWVGHPGFAALAFLALGLTVLVRQLEAGTGDAGKGMLLAIVLSSAISAGAASLGGMAHDRARSHRRGR
jgi:hypothetical protein